MSPGTIKTVGVIGFIAICALCLAFRSGPIEEDLLSRSQAGLKAAGLTASKLSFDGRNAILEGEVHSKEDVQQLKESIGAVYGVHKVKDRMTLIPKITSMLNLNFQNGDLSFEGLLPEGGMSNDLGAKLKSAFGSGISLEGLKTDVNAISADWFAGVLPALQKIRPFMNSGKIALSGKNIALSGSAQSFDAKSAIEGFTAAMQEQGITVDNQLDIPEPPAAYADLRKQIDDLLAVKKINFNTNSAVLTATSVGTVRELSQIIKKYGDLHFEIRGHTDASGNSDFNQHLSQMRAEKVCAKLVSYGIAESRLAAKGFGASVPIASNATPEGRAENRRVEFRISGKEE